MTSDLDFSNLISSRRREIEEARRARVGGLIVGIVVAIVLAVVVWADIASADEPTPVVAWEWSRPRVEYEERINAFLAAYFDRCSPRKLARALEVVPILLDEAEAADVNPAIVAAIVTRESTWNAAAVGDLGEVGLMQVNRPRAPADPRENLRAGIAILVESYRVCNNVEGAIAMYATGHGCRWARAASRVNLAARIERGAE